MLIFYLFTLAVLGLPLLGLWPIYLTNHSGQGASNNPWLISMPPHSAYGGSALHWRAVFAEELVEHYVRWLVALAIVHGALLLIPHDDRPVTGAVAGFAAVLLCLWTAFPLGTRIVEYVGKAAFSIVRGWAVDSEAGFLLSAYPAFEGMTVAQTSPALRRAAPIARVLVWLLSLRLRRIAV